MDENEQQLADELQSVIDRVKAALTAAGDLQDVQWDAESDCLTVYDPESEHTIAVNVDWA